MSWLDSITSLVKDPPPAYVFELSEAGLAYSIRGHAEFEHFPEGVLVPSPVEDNLRRPEAITTMLARIAPAGGPKKRTPAALILPDYAARVTVLDFDSFPSTPEEQTALVKFRVKKTVPFDIESAAVSHWIQPGRATKGKIEVVAVTVALEILAKYEALFRNTGFQAGEVTTSGIAAMNLCRDGEMAVLAKLCGKVLSVMVLAEGRLKLFRCLPLRETPGEADDEEILSVLLPTFAYAEDELGTQVKKLILCGFPDVPQGLPVEAEVLHGRSGIAGAYNAGLAGYMEGAAA
jgi:type IV pilus assembly protein PilM